MVKFLLLSGIIEIKKWLFGNRNKVDHQTENYDKACNFFIFTCYQNFEKRHLYLQID